MSKLVKYCQQQRRQFLRQCLALSSATLVAPYSRSSFAQKKTRILVVGGGYAGASAARYLQKHAQSYGLDISLITASASYTPQPLSQLILTDTDENIIPSPQYDYSALEKQGISVIKQAAARLDLANKRVFLEDGNDLVYDKLIVATGVEIDDRLKGYNAAVQARYPHAIHNTQQLKQLAQHIHELPDKGLILFSLSAKQGIDPVYAYERISLSAWYLKHYKPQARIRVLDASGEFPLRDDFLGAWEHYYGFNSDDSLIELIHGEEAKVAEIQAEASRLVTQQNKEVHHADVINPMLGLRAHALLRAANLSDLSGYCPVSLKDFTIEQNNDVFIIGDAAKVGELPKTAFIASVSARLCAINLLASLSQQNLQQPIWLNACYPLVTPEHALSLVEHYRLLNNTITKQTKTGTMHLQQNNFKLDAYYARSRHQHLLQQAFGQKMADL